MRTTIVTKDFASAAESAVDESMVDQLFIWAMQLLASHGVDLNRLYLDATTAEDLARATALFVKSNPIDETGRRRPSPWPIVEVVR